MRLISSIPDAIPRTRSSSFYRIDKPLLDSDCEEMGVEDGENADVVIIAAVGVGVMKVDRDTFVVIASELFVLADVVLEGVGVVLESNISCSYGACPSALISLTSFLSPLLD